MRVVLRVVRLALVVMLVSSCAVPPPTLSPVGVADFKATQALEALALVRNIAIAAHATTPPLISEKTTGAVVSWHRSTIIVVNAREPGWEGRVLAALTELEQQLAATERARFVPYLTLARTVVQEVVR